MSKGLIATTIGAFTLGILLMSASAMAATATYPGATCHRISGGTFAYWYGTAVNQSTSSELLLSCPFVKRSSGINSGWVEVFDRHPSYNVSCELRSEHASGSTIYYYSDTRTSTSYGANYQRLSFGGLAGYSNGYYYAECSVPRAYNGNYSHVIAFGIDEP